MLKHLWEAWENLPWPNQFGFVSALLIVAITGVFGAINNFSRDRPKIGLPLVGTLALALIVAALCIVPSRPKATNENLPTATPASATPSPTALPLPIRKPPVRASVTPSPPATPLPRSLNPLTQTQIERATERMLKRGLQGGWRATCLVNQTPKRVVVMWPTPDNRYSHFTLPPDGKPYVVAQQGDSEMLLTLMVPHDDRDQPFSVGELANWRTYSLASSQVFRSEPSDTQIQNLEPVYLRGDVSGNPAPFF